MHADVLQSWMAGTSPAMTKEERARHMRANSPSGLAFVESVNVLLASGRPPPGAIEPRLIRADPRVKPEGRLSPFQGEGFYVHSPLADRVIPAKAGIQGRQARRAWLLDTGLRRYDVDGRDKPGHDEA